MLSGMKPAVVWSSRLLIIATSGHPGVLGSSGVYWMRSLAAALAICLTASGSLSAQVVRGRILDASEHRSIPVAAVSLLTREAVEVSSTHTDEDGRFHLVSPTAGGFYLYVEALGFQPALEGSLNLTEGDTVEIDVVLVPSPLLMDPIVVEAETQPRRLRMVGFFERKQSGFGAFIEREEIERRDPRFLSDLFRARPGFRLVYGAGGAELVSRRTSTFLGGCKPLIYLDGLPMVRGAIDDLVHPSLVEAIEAYSGISQLPAQYSGAESACGVVLVWTRRGGRPS